MNPRDFIKDTKPLEPMPSPELPTEPKPEPSTFDFKEEMAYQPNRESSLWQKEQPNTIDETFRQYLPDSLYMSHYELHQIAPTYSADEWRDYIKQSHRFIQSELSVITEAAARHALSKLGEGTDTSSLRELLSKSRMLQNANNQKETILFSYIPPKLDKPIIPEEQEQQPQNTEGW